MRRNPGLLGRFGRAGLALALGLAFGTAGLGAACVPTGSAPAHDAGAPPPAAPTFRASANVMTAPFEDDFERPDAGTKVVVVGAPDATPDAFLALAVRTDAGETGPLLTLEAGSAEPPRQDDLGPNWTAMRTNAWKIENGKLCGENAHNHGIWLEKVLPVNARIEFDATSYSDDGDLKAEVWGSGRSYATGTSYTNATSYLAILGGWKNTIHALARLNEHGTDRKEIHVDKDSDDPRQRAVVKGQTYHFKIERTDGKTVRWLVDDVEYLTFIDANPLAGQGHDHFGFNEWEVKVCFDNVKVTPL